MTEKDFIIADITFTVYVESFSKGQPGRLWGPPEDCYPSDGPEIELRDKVTYVTEENLEVCTIDFVDFIMIYAADNTHGDTDKAVKIIEDDLITELFENGCEY